MTSEMPVKIGRHKFICKVGGYTGKTESADPIEDILDGYMIWLDARQSRLVGRVGKRVTVTIGGKKFEGKIIGGPSRTRYSDIPGRLKKVIISPRVGDKLTRSEVEKLHRQAIKAKNL